ncbi:hypothetical protein [uncultured Cohaesibacter sp.]|uniref:hypothetical protein n=1 Tax=uncultured Cohaesibacter sp. TaxID=1002546 RepID=UPI00292F20E8|nr:hypothetical protein [uncultured Cohaesibacter sp.]
MIFCVQGRASEAPKPPQTQLQRRNFIVAIESEHAGFAREEAKKVLEKNGYSFVTVVRVLTVTGNVEDPAIAEIVDQARRNGVGIAIYR